VKKTGPIPTEIDFGCALVHVRLVSKKGMIEAVDDDIEVGDGEAINGLWDQDIDTIFIGKWLPRKVQRWTLFHEAGHAMLDLRDRYDKD
jgi:Zn-dependent peptidase ImmA (M78 family)